MVRESSATSANFTRTNNTQSLAAANRDVMQILDFLITLFFGWKKLHVLCKNNSVRKVVNDRLSKIFVNRALPYGTI